MFGGVARVSWSPCELSVFLSLGPHRSQDEAQTPCYINLAGCADHAASLYSGQPIAVNSLRKHTNMDDFEDEKNGDSSMVQDGVDAVGPSKEVEEVMYSDVRNPRD